MTARKPQRGGARPGAGRPRKDGALSAVVSPRFAPAELAIMRSVLRPGETLTGFVRLAAIGLLAMRKLEAP